MTRKARDWTVITERVNNRSEGLFTYKEYLENRSLNRKNLI